MFLINSKRNKFLVFLILVLVSSLIWGQSRNKLEKQKQQSLNKIKETEKIIKETKSQKKATLGQLNAISKQIEARQDLISSISHELLLIDEEIQEKVSVIEALESDLKDLKEEYAAAIFAASKMDNSIYKLASIFSAETLNQMIMRIKYFEQYSQARKTQLEEIEKVKIDLAEQKEVLNAKRIEKTILLNSQTTETENLNSLKKEKDIVVKELSKKESELRKELEETKKSIKQLENKIREVIEEERRKAIEAEKARQKEKEREEEREKEKFKKTTPKELASTFGGNISRLPWPVSNGTIVRKFGHQMHPVLKIEENNLGVGIQTLKGEKVKSVFGGKIISVTEIPGMNKIVMIQHGDYFTVYARLKKALVVVGQQVSSKEAIGEVYTNKEDESMVEFQIWKGNSPLDPETWLLKK